MDAIKLQEQLRGLVEQKQKLDSQLHELNMAKEEVDLLENDAVIYKLVGPLMVPQKLPDVKENIKARMKYLDDNVAYTDKEIKDKHTKLTESRQQMQLQKQTIPASSQKK